MAEQLLLAERAARVQLERQLAEARATIASLQMQLSPVLSDCSDLSTTQKKLSVQKGVRKKKKASKEPKVKIPGQSRYWTPEEHKLFLEALRRFGHKDLRSISAYVGTRNMTQVRTHSQKYFMRLMREAKRQNPTTANPTTNTTANKNNNNTSAAAGVSTSDADSDPASQRSGSTSNALPSSDNEQKPEATGAPQSGATTTSTTGAPAAPTADPNADKYSVPNTCGMTLLCLVGQDTLTN